MSDELHVQLKINLSYELNGVSEKDIIRLLERLPQTIASHGGFTSDSPAVVMAYDSDVHVFDFGDRREDELGLLLGAAKADLDSLGDIDWNGDPEEFNRHHATLVLALKRVIKALFEIANLRKEG